MLLSSAPPKSASDENSRRDHRILRIPYTAAGQSEDPALSYRTLSAAETADRLLPTGTAPAAASRTVAEFTPAQLQQYTIHVFEREGRFTPTRLVVNGRKGRRVVVVLAEDGKHYRVLDLDYPSQREEEEGETEVEVGEDGDTVMSGL